MKNPIGKYIIVRRSPNKKSFPNRYDLSVCGNVNCGESYEEAAVREMKEELGVSGKVNFLKKIYSETEEYGKKLKYFTGIFSCVVREPVISCEEFSKLEVVTLKEIDERIKENPDLFCPFFLLDYQSVRSLLGGKDA